MKHILTILFLFIAVSIVAQTPPSRVRGAGSPNVDTYNPGFASADSGTVITSFPDTATANRGPFIKWRNGVQIKVGTRLYFRDTLSRKWIEVSSGSSGIISGGPMTSTDAINFNPGVNISIDSFVKATWYRAQAPTATLTGGVIYEYTSASTFGATLNWSASRQLATTPLNSIVVAGINQTFSQPSAPGTVSGTQAVTVTSNTVVTYDNVVTASNGQTVTVSTVFTPRNKYYIGYVATSTPTDANIRAALGGTVGGTFATSFVTAGTLPAPPSESYIVFAFPATFGTATIKINGLAVGYFLTTRSFVNASGYSVSYNIYVSPFSTNGGIEYQVL